MIDGAHKSLEKEDQKGFGKIQGKKEFVEEKITVKFPLGLYLPSKHNEPAFVDFKIYIIEYSFILVMIQAGGIALRRGRGPPRPAE